MGYNRERLIRHEKRTVRRPYYRDKIVEISKAEVLDLLSKVNDTSPLFPVANLATEVVNRESLLHAYKCLTHEGINHAIWTAKIIPVNRAKVFRERKANPIDDQGKRILSVFQAKDLRKILVVPACHSSSHRDAFLVALLF